MSTQQETPLSKDVRNWGMGVHLIALVGLLGNGIGLLVGPLVIWLMKREDHPFIDEQGKEAVNFQLSIFMYMLACIPLIFVAIGVLLLPLLAIFDTVMVIIAGIKAADGVHYRYPLTVRFLK